jgi:hypothetical protein
LLCPNLYQSSGFWAAAIFVISLERGTAGAQFQCCLLWQQRTQVRSCRYPAVIQAGQLIQLGREVHDRGGYVVRDVTALRIRSNSWGKKKFDRILRPT